MTNEEIRAWASRVITGKKRPSPDFVAGVWALANALQNVVNDPEVSINHPVPGMIVRCRTRPCDLRVLAVTAAERKRERDGAGGMSASVKVHIEPHDGWGRTKFFQVKDARVRRLWLSTYRRWVKGGKVLTDGSPREG